MTESERKLASALSWMVAQYLEQPDGSLDHMCMSAGEGAISVLSELGLVNDKGRRSEWTVTGKAFLENH